MASKRTPGGRSQSRLAGTIAAITALVAINVALIAGALDHMGVGGVDVVPFLGPEPIAEADLIPPTFEPVVEEPDEGTPVTAASIPPRTRVITGSPDGGLWRAEIGSCPGGDGVIERSDNDGESWVRTASNTTGAQSILALRPSTSADEVGAIAQIGASCRGVGIFTLNAGAEWETSPAAIDVAFLDPNRPNAVSNGFGAIVTPCTTVAQVASNSLDRVAVLCDDTTLHATTDGGVEWSEFGSYPEGAGLTTLDNSYAVFRTGVAGCDGVAVILLGEDANSAARCADVGAVNAVAAASVGTRLILWADDTVISSLDRGESWLAPGEDPDGLA